MCVCVCVCVCPHACVKATNVHGSGESDTVMCTCTYIHAKLMSCINYYDTCTMYCALVSFSTSCVMAEQQAACRASTFSMVSFETD